MKENMGNGRRKKLPQQQKGACTFYGYKKSRRKVLHNSLGGQIGSSVLWGPERRTSPRGTDYQKMKPSKETGQDYGFEAGWALRKQEKNLYNPNAIKVTISGIKRERVGKGSADSGSLS